MVHVSSFERCVRAFVVHIYYQTLLNRELLWKVTQLNVARYTQHGMHMR